MEENLHNIDKLFKDQLEDHEDLPSAKVWDTLDAQLDKKNVVRLQKKYNALKRIAAILVIMLAGTLAYQQFKKSQRKNEIVNTIPEKAKTNTVNQPKSSNVNSPDSSFTKKDSVNSIGANITNKNADDSLTKIADEKAINLKPIESKEIKGNNIQLRPSETKIANKPIRSQKLDIRPIRNNSNLQNPVPNKNFQAQQKDIGKNMAPDLNVQNKNQIFNKENQPEKIEQTDSKTDLKNNSTTIVKKNDKFEQATVGNLPELLAPENIEIAKNELITYSDASVVLLSNNFKEKIKYKNIRLNTTGSNFLTGTKFSITPFFSPQISFNHLTDNDANPGGGQRPPNRNDIKKTEQEQTTILYGLNISMDLNKHWGIQSGFNVLNKSIDIQPQKIYADRDNNGEVRYRLDCSSGYTFIAPQSGTTLSIGDSTSTGAGTNKSRYFSVPLSVYYKINIGRISIIPSFGASINILSKQQISTSLVQGGGNLTENTSSIQGLKPNYYSALAGIFFEYNLNRRFAISLAPTGNFALSSITQNAPVNSFPSSFGGSVGLKINL